MYHNLNLKTLATFFLPNFERILNALLHLQPGCSCLFVILMIYLRICRKSTVFLDSGETMKAAAVESRL